MTPQFKTTNLNALWASLVIEELRRNVVKYFCLAPGSRSAPLAVAVAENPKIKSLVHFDERGLGFYALGVAAATRKPTAVITTSGTAVANLLPSIIEASKKKLPLIILTADRPPELRSTGANQTIDQVKIFGDYVRFFFDLPCPTLEISPTAVLSTVDQLVSRSQGELPGPVHLNLMFREPLSPHENKRNYSVYLKEIESWGKSEKPYTRYPKLQILLGKEPLAEAAKIINNAKFGIIAVGKLSAKEDETAVLKLAKQLNWPIFADVTSGLRLGQNCEEIINHFDHLLTVKKRTWPIDAVLHLGGRLTSSRWLKLLKENQPKDYLMVLRHPLRHDPTHQVSLRLQSSIESFCRSLCPLVLKHKVNKFTNRLKNAEIACSKIIELNLSSKELSEPHLARILSLQIPKDSGLFIGNSMPIRELNLFASNKGKNVTVFANRGASGIDGNIATAAGIAQSLNKPLTAVLGDLAFLHDLNSLNLIRGIKIPFVLIVINNDGGAIFSFLPIANWKGQFTEFFTAAHGLNFEQASRQFSIAHQRITEPDQFKFAYQQAIFRPGPTILEVICDTQVTQKVHDKIRKTLAKKLKI